MDWPGLLTRYEWDGDWRNGLESRLELSRLLQESLATGTPREVVDRITRWGRVPPLRGEALDRVLASLDVLGDDRESLTAGSSELYAKRIALVSKVYAMHRLDRWVIYDSAWRGRSRRYELRFRFWTKSAASWARSPERSHGARAVSALDPDAVDEQWASAAFVSLASLLDDSYLRKA